MAAVPADVLDLVCHPATRSSAIKRVQAEARWLPGGLLGFYYLLEGKTDAVRLPTTQQPTRVDGLWQHTCCEAFVAGPENGGYSEFNFAPSGAWAAYGFTAYREGMKPVAVVADPVIELRMDKARIEIDAVIGSRSLPTGEKGLRFGLAVVVEDLQGGLSYWALSHPAERPDFHHAAGFHYSLPPAA